MPIPLIVPEDWAMSLTIDKVEVEAEAEVQV
jgi:hypothetical protein